MGNLTALKMMNINKYFPGVQALKDVDFSLEYGEIHALVGENGAGKSTLMNVLMGIYKADTGNILIDEKIVAIDSPTTAISHGVGMVPQELNLVPDITVAENIFLGIERKRKCLGIDWKKTYHDAEKLLESLGLKIDVRKKLNEFTVAYSQLVQIARTLAYGAKIIIMDEPTACLTIKECEILFNILRQLKKDGNAIIFISHHMDEIKKISDRITVMRDGSVVGTKPSINTSIDEIINMMAGCEVLFERKERENKYSDSILIIDRLTRKHEFNEISFEVKKGEIFGIAGLVGSGRTELVKAIYGATIKDSGSIIFEDKVVNIKSPAQAIRLGIGYLPEERRELGLFPILSVAENIVMPILKKLCNKFGISNRKKRALVDEYIKSLKIKTPAQTKMIKDLSGGNQQKAILARWLAKDVKLLILDEPTRGIDVNAKAEIHELIRTITNNGKTIIVISSELEELMVIADRIMVIHEGELKGFVDPALSNPEEILTLALN